MRGDLRDVDIYVATKIILGVARHITTDLPRESRAFGTSTQRREFLRIIRTRISLSFSLAIVTYERPTREGRWGAEGKRRKMEDILKLFAENTGARHSRIPD